MSNSDKGKQGKPQDGTKTGHDRSTGTKHETNDMALLMDIPTPKPHKMEQKQYLHIYIKYKIQLLTLSPPKGEIVPQFQR